jgi:thiol-disulfide isomerase/thioredoxin
MIKTMHHIMQIFYSIQKQSFGVNTFKSFLCTLILLLSSMIVMAQSHYIIDGTVNHLKGGICLNLFRMDGDVGSPVAVDTLCGNRFHMEIESLGLKTEEFDLIIRDGSIYTMASKIWAKPGSHINVTGDDINVYTWKVESDVPQQNIWNIFIEDSRDLWNEFQLNNIKLKQLLAASHENTDNGLRKNVKSPFLVQRDSLQQILDSIQVLIDARTIERMKKLPIEEVWMRQLKSLARNLKYNHNYPYKKEVEILYGRLSEEQRNSDVGQDINEYLSSSHAVNKNDKLEDGELYDLQGHVHHLSDFLEKPVLLDFWSQGCGPCQSAMPEMEEISKKYAERLVIVSISIDNKFTWKTASRHHNMTWSNLSDLKGEHGLYAKYRKEGIPRYVFLSAKGKVVDMWTGYSRGSLLNKLDVLMNKEMKK